MKKVAFYLTTLLLSVASTNAAIIFNPANALNVVDEGGFTGTISAGGSGYEQARLIFNFSGLSTASFQISNISLKGPGITSSLSFPSLTIAGNGESLSSLVALNTNVSSLNFATDGVTVSFNVLAGVVNDGASFEVDVSYQTLKGFRF